MKTVIFAGSGFSKAVFDQKIQQELLRDFINSDESNLYRKFLPDDLISLVNHIDDIELIMSHYLNLGYTGLPHKHERSKIHQKMIVYLRMALALYYREKFANKATNYYRNETRDYVTQYFHNAAYISPHNLCFITTNYDLGLEIIVEDIYGKGSYYYPGFESRPGKDIAIPICKLHGSINWLEDRGHVTGSGFSNYRRQNIYCDVLNDLKVMQTKSKKGFVMYHKKTKYTPIMVPFFHQKSMWSEINQPWWGDKFTKTWKSAYDCLRAADNIRFWGYGLPSADYHMFSFLSEVMKNTQAKCEVVDFIDDRELHNPDLTDSILLKLLKHLYISSNNNVANLRHYKKGLIDYYESHIET